MTTILSHELQRMLKQVAPHVGTDSTIPVIAAVHLESRDGYLYAVTTDRYTMAISRQPVLNTGEWKTAIAGAHIPSLTAWLKNVDEVTLQVDNGDTPQLTLSGPVNSMTIAALPSSDKLPDWRGILRKYLDTEIAPIPLSGVTAKYLARWKESAQILHMWQATPRAPIVFMDEGSQFIGMQMPIRNDHTNRDELIDGWRKSLTRYVDVGDIRFNLDEDMVDRDGDPWKCSGEERGGEPLVHLLGIEDDTFTLSSAVSQFGLRPAA
ncbi:phiSA1p31-related protein [Streptomyces sp. NPDC058700]|uniref:phiSA1p31-related protein n=1 Tax=Streptomyces sp. NPDC058700 TaxID=3346607 RepID=UPI003649328A